MVSMAWEGIARARKINPATADAKMVVVFFFFHVFSSFILTIKAKSVEIISYQNRTRNPF